MIEDVKKDAAERMTKCVAALRNELKKLRTGRASTSLLEHVRVDYYGSEVPLQQLAGFSVPEARQLLITPYDKGAMGAIEKAIQHSDLGLNPAGVGELVRVPIPAMTEERRKDLVKVVRHEAEQGKVAVRNIRRDAIAHLKDLLKNHEISEDDERRAQDDVQKLTDKYIAEMDKALAEKEKDLMAV